MIGKHTYTLLEDMKLSFHGVCSLFILHDSCLELLDDRFEIFDFVALVIEHGERLGQLILGQTHRLLLSLLLLR